MSTPDPFDVPTRAAGPQGSLPLTAEMLRTWSSGDLFGLSLNAGMGWNPARTADDEYLILSTQGGLRAPDGTPLALGYHTGHWEVGLLVEEAAAAFRAAGCTPFAGAVSDPCDGRTQGTPGMMDSLPYRNDAAMTLRRLIRSLPRRKGVVGVATCDKGLPAMMMALAGCAELAGAIVPGGVTLPPADGEDAGKIQTIGARFAHGEIDAETAADLGCRACATPGGGCQFLGTAATMQVLAEALGMTPWHAALAPSGTPIWRANAKSAAEAVRQLSKRGVALKDILTAGAVRNAMAVHAAIGGSTNALLHVPAVAFHAGLPRPTADDWRRANAAVPRLVDALPNGPVGHPTVRVFLAGGTPEVMLHLRRLGALATDVLTLSGRTLGAELDAWERSERRAKLRDRLRAADGIDPDDVIMDPARAAAKGLVRTLVFPGGNLAPEGSVVKATAIDPSVRGPDGVYRKTGPARVFTTERAAIAAVKSTGPDRILPGTVMVLCCRGPLGSGMEETYQITSALRYLPFGKEVALLTDARFSGVSTGACVGHIGPEALAGGPLGKLRDGDLLQVTIDPVRLEGSLDLVGAAAGERGPEWGAGELARRSPRPDLAPDPGLPADTKLWAALQAASGGAWGGCVYDPDAIVAALRR